MWCQDICFSMGATGTSLDDYGKDRWGDGVREEVKDTDR